MPLKALLLVIQIIHLPVVLQLHLLAILAYLIDGNQSLNHMPLNNLPLVIQKYLIDGNQSLNYRPLIALPLAILTYLIDGNQSLNYIPLIAVFYNKTGLLSILIYTSFIHIVWIEYEQHHQYSNDLDNSSSRKHYSLFIMGII